MPDLDAVRTKSVMIKKFYVSSLINFSVLSLFITLCCQLFVESNYKIAQKRSTFEKTFFSFLCASNIFFDESGSGKKGLSLKCSNKRTMMKSKSQKWRRRECILPSKGEGKVSSPFWRQFSSGLAASE